MRKQLLLALALVVAPISDAEVRCSGVPCLDAKVSPPVAYEWSNAQVVALGASLTGDITMTTLPAKTVVRNAYVVITGQAAGTATLTVACGRTAAAYIDYIVASDAKAAVNTVYGDASGERGTNLTGYDLPSYTATTTIRCHFISTVQNLNAVTGSSGRLILQTDALP